MRSCSPLETVPYAAIVHTTSDQEHYMRSTYQHTGGARPFSETGTGRVATALRDRALAAQNRSSSVSPGTAMVAEALLDALDRGPQRQSQDSVQLAHYEGLMDPKMTGHSLDHGLLGYVTPSFGSVDAIVDEAYDDVLNDDPLGRFIDPQLQRYGSRNGQADATIGPLDLLSGVSALGRGAFGAAVARTRNALRRESPGFSPPASAFTGRKRLQLQNRPKTGFTRNRRAVVGGRLYTGHALDGMQNRGTTPRLVEDTISRGIVYRNPRSGKTMIYDPTNDITVVVVGKRVITVRFGKENKLK